MVHDLNLEQGDVALIGRSVVAVADAAERSPGPGFGQMSGAADRYAADPRSL
ncbi:hypothetical protein ACFQY5_31290 [Paeniroseomonas aquatica]|uniref:hypothetical protein n=1 Tax=Paeniroseomonas aquatica TaxID=373043 RepID=UPI0036073475